jgi:RNA polymerase sigma-70 factor, ECF subfamily
MTADAIPGTRLLDPADLGTHLDRLYRGALALCGSRERAEDLVQDTYARVLARPRFLRKDDDLGYLLRVMRNTFFSQQRAARRRPALATTSELERFEDAAAMAPPAVADARRVFDAIAALPVHYREALVAIDVVGVSYRDAARALGVSQGTVASRVFRARERIADALELGVDTRPQRKDQK